MFLKNLLCGVDVKLWVTPLMYKIKAHNMSGVSPFKSNLLKSQKEIHLECVMHNTE